jgi:ATP-dependent helicase/nuclease subunit B
MEAKGETMRTMIHEIGSYCRDNVLQEKWLVAPSLRVGNQWMDAVARVQPVFNLRLFTLRNLALHIVGPQLVAEHRQVLAGDQGALLMLEVFCRLRDDGKLKYLSGVQPSLDFGRLLFSDWNRMVEAGESFADASSDSFRPAHKLDDLRCIEAEFLELLEQRRAISFSQILEEAHATYRGNSHAITEGVRILIPHHLPRSHVERQLVEALEHRIQRIGSSSVDLTSNDPFAEVQGAGVHYFAALGAPNEVRQVLRICSERSLKLDQVEVVCSDPDTYMPLYLEELAARSGENQGLGEGLPVTFSQGIACRYSRPGRALQEFASWIRDGFPQSSLARMLKEGLLRLPSGLEEATVSMSRLGRLVGSLPIGAGLDRYESQIEQALSDCIAAGEQIRTDEDHNDPQDLEKKLASNHRLKTELQILRQLVREVVCPWKEIDVANPAQLLAGVRSFMQHYVRCVNKLDQFAHQRLMDPIKAMDDWVRSSDERLSMDLIDWLVDLPQSCRVMGSGPQPGCLHVSSIFDGGASGRSFRFVMGLDDRRFPPSGFQSPLLLDDEASDVSEDMPTGESYREQGVRRFIELAADPDPETWYSLSTLELEENKPQFPSYILLDLFRHTSGKPDAAQEDFLRHVTPLASFAPVIENQSLNPADWWLWRLTTPEKVRDARELVLQRYPNIRSGQRALAEVASDSFTPHDGMVPAAGAALDPTVEGVVCSPSRLETAGKCPRKFFFKYGLRLEPPDVFEVDGKWLDPLEYGTFFHKVVELYVDELIRQNAAIDEEVNGARLHDILEEQLALERKANPPPSERAYQDQAEQLRTAATMFLRMETKYCREQHYRPLQVEARLGLEPLSEREGVLDCEEPIEIPLDSGNIRVRGKVDRIDVGTQGNERELMIWDYKTGSSYSYSQQSPIFAGRRLQPYLYCEMVRQRLIKKMPGYSVAGFGYSFPNSRRGIPRLPWKVAELASGRSALNLISEIIRSGHFHATDCKDDCEYCEYRDICGDPEIVTLGVKKKLAQNPDAKSAFQSLREIS